MLPTPAATTRNGGDGRLAHAAANWSLIHDGFNLIPTRLADASDETDEPS